MTLQVEYLTHTSMLSHTQIYYSVLLEATAVAPAPNEQGNGCNGSGYSAWANGCCLRLMLRSGDAASYVVTGCSQRCYITCRYVFNVLIASLAHADIIPEGYTSDECNDMYHQRPFEGEFCASPRLPSGALGSPDVSGGRRRPFRARVAVSMLKNPAPQHPAS